MSGLFFFHCISALWKISLNRLGLYNSETAIFVVGVMNLDGSSLYFDAGVSGPSSKSAAVGPSSPKGSTMNGLSWYLRFRHSAIISDPCVLLAWVRFGPRNFSTSKELKCLKTAGVM